MNIELKYKGNSYKFDLPKDATLKYIKNLESNIVNEDISNFNLFYKNNLISNYPETTLLSDLSKDDKNISIIIIPKNKVLSIFNKKCKISQLKEFGNSQSINSLKLLINARSLSPIKSENKNSVSKSKNFLDYLSEFRVFKETYNLKENIIYTLMKNLSQKIQEYNDNLYKKIKKNKHASELPLFEKNVIKFQDKQINYLKKLINYFEDKEKDFISGAIPLFDFYEDLNKFDDKKDIKNINNIQTENNMDKELNSNNINDNNINSNMNRLSSISIKKIVRNEREENALPFLNNNKSIEKKNLMSENNQNYDSISEKEDSNDDEEEKNELAKNEIFNSKIKVKKSRNVIKFPNTTIKKEKRIYKTIDNYKNKNNEENIYNDINISNVRDKINQNSISQKKTPKSIVIYITEKNEKKEDEKDPKALNKENEKEKDTEKDIDSDEEKGQGKRRSSIIKNFIQGHTKLENKNDINNYIFQRSKQDRRYKTRKRIGINENDFII
jgi:hypothetical protein